MHDHEGHAGRTHRGERLRYLRRHHPDGPVTAGRLAEMSGVSERHVQNVESGTSNVTVEVLEEITHALGIDRVAYLLDEDVFNPIDAELRSLQEALTLGVLGIRLRSHDTSFPETHPGQTEIMAGMLAQIAELGDEAKRIQRDLSPS